jgi:fermentation-respiration switch protein FrsA (DUF1100 family)
MWYELSQRLERDAARRVTTGEGERVDFSVLLPGPAPLAPDDPTLVMYPEGYPLENLSLAAGFRPEAVIASISPRPVCLVGCLDDTVVSVEETESLYAAAREPKEITLFPSGNHIGPMGPLVDETAALIDRFLSAHLSPAPAR